MTDYGSAPTIGRSDGLAFTGLFACASLVGESDKSSAVPSRPPATSRPDHAKNRMCSQAMATGLSGSLRRSWQTWRVRPAAVMLVLAGAALSLGAGCRAPLGDIQVILERHQKAVEKLPEQQRSRLLPYGTAVTGEQAEELLPEGVLSMEAARAVAIRANPDIHAAQARLANAAARITEARARYYPTIVFTHNSSSTFLTPASRNRLNTMLQPAVPAPADIDTSSIAVTTLLNAIRLPLFGLDKPKGNRNPFSEHSTAFTVTWTVFDGFMREAQLLAAKHLHSASLSALVDLERLIIRAVDTAYYQVQLAQEQLRIAMADEEFSREQLEETEKLRIEGRASKADVDNFRVRALAAKADVTAAVGAREIGRVVLAELMGLTCGTLPSDLQLAPLAEESAEEMAPPKPAPWIQRAESNRPDIRQLEHILTSDEEQVRAAKGLFMPSAAVSGSWGFDRSSNLRYTYEDQSAAAAFELRWELFTGGSRSARVRQAECARAESAARLSRMRLAIQSEVRQVVIDLENAQQQILLRGETLETARENRRIVRAGYLAGKETLTRLNEAHRDFITADADLALARIRLRQSWTDLYAAVAIHREASGSGPEPGEQDPSKSD